MPAKILPSTLKTVRGCQLLALFLFLMQVYSLAGLISGEAILPASVMQGLIHSFLAVGAGILIGSARTYFPVNSKERRSFFFIGIGLGILGLDELSSINPEYIYSRISVKIVAAILFILAFIRARGTFLPDRS